MIRRFRSCKLLFYRTLSNLPDFHDRLIKNHFFKLFETILFFRMELYFIDCIWILVTIASVAITSRKIITNNILFQQLATFGKTRVKKFPFDVPKAWFSHFYVLGSCFLSFLLYRWCLGKDWTQIYKLLNLQIFYQSKKDGQPSLPEIGLMSITMTPIFDLRLFLASSSKHKGVMRLLVVDFDGMAASFSTFNA